MALKFTCNVCLHDFPPEQLFRPQGFLQTPILCDTCGAGIVRYYEMKDELHCAALILLRDTQTDLLIQAHKAEVQMKLVEREQRKEERRAKRLAFEEPNDDAEYRRRLEALEQIEDGVTPTGE